MSKKGNVLAWIVVIVVLIAVGLGVAWKGDFLIGSISRLTAGGVTFGELMNDVGTMRAEMYGVDLAGYAACNDEKGKPVKEGYNGYCYMMQNGIIGEKGVDFAKFSKVLSREQGAYVVYRGLGLNVLEEYSCLGYQTIDEPVIPNPIPVLFTDVADSSSIFGASINGLGELGVLDSKAGKKFNPKSYLIKAREQGWLNNVKTLFGKNVTRAKAVKYAAFNGCIFPLTPSDENSGTFDDVPPTYPEFGYIEALVEAGIIAETSGNFNPEQNVTRGNFVKTLVMAFGIEVASDYGIPIFSDVPKTSWVYNYVEAAVANGIVTDLGSQFFPDNMLTVKDAVVWLNNGAEF